MFATSGQRRRSALEALAVAAIAGILGPSVSLSSALAPTAIVTTDRNYDCDLNDANSVNNSNNCPKCRCTSWRHCRRFPGGTSLHGLSTPHHGITIERKEPTRRSALPSSMVAGTGVETMTFG